MRSCSRWLTVVGLCALCLTAVAAAGGPGGASDGTKPVFDSAAALADLEKSIAGHENDPAETVFKNIQTFKGVPAGRVLKIMESGMNRSLGVGCNHCHEAGKWDADTEKKRISREMSKMTAEINVRVHLIDGVGDDAAINCTTCHRGETTPALELVGSH